MGKRFMSMMRKIKDNKKTSWLVVALFLVALIVMTFIGIYVMVTGQIKEIAVQNMREMALHDEVSVESNIDNEYQILDGIGTYIGQMKCSTQQELLLTLSQCSLIIDCKKLTLVSENGKTLSSDQVAAYDEDLLKQCMDTEAHYVFWIEDNEDSAGAQLYFGAETAPFTVEEETYWYITAEMDIDILQENLKVESYDGEGYSNIIDAEGNYIVNNSYSYAAQNMNNFFDKLLLGTLRDDWTIEKIQGNMAAQEKFSMMYTNMDGEDQLLIFMPMEKENWYFIMAIPDSIIQGQVRDIIMLYLIFWLLSFAVMTAATVIVIREERRMAGTERKHQKELSEALELANQGSRAKTTFLNNMSHDIRTPMNAIMGYTSLAITHIDKGEQVKDYLEKIYQSSAHLLSLINDVLDMSRIESGKLEIEEKPESLSDILHTLRDMMQADIRSKQLDFYIDIMGVTDEDIYCDKLRLNQVLINIVSNAIKYNRPGGSISISVVQKGAPKDGYGIYDFCIKDTGIGIGEEYLHEIFEPFTRERNSTISGIQGTGLGMAITKNIVDAMGGTIKVSSKEGKGSRFIVTLKFRLQKEHKEIAVIEKLQGLRGLVVDDDVNACQSVSHMLRQIGMLSEWTRFGKEAVIRTKEALNLGDPFYVYIIDWLMPDMNGVETARQIRKEVGENAPIIILTAYDWADIEQEARAAGVTDFVSKPLFLSDLRSMLSRICAEETQTEIQEDAPLNFHGTRILLVEDNLWNQEVAQEILTNFGLTVETVNNGQEAVTAVETADAGWYAMVFMDVQMPVMNGYDAAKAIRTLTNPEKARIPIVAMTADAFEQDRQKALQAGMNDHISKPLDMEALVKVLKKYIENNKE